MADRKSNGHFAKGNQVAKGHDGSNAGRPPRPVEEAYLHAIKEAMPTKRWIDCLQTYAALAEAGDRYALRFFADYLLGRPIEYREQLGEKVFRVIYEQPPRTDSGETATRGAASIPRFDGQTQDNSGG